MDSPSRSRRAVRASLRSLLAVALATGALTALDQGDRPGPATAEATGKRFAVRGDGAGRERLVRYGPPAAAVMDVHRPATRHARPLPAVLVVHGGGWRFGDKRRMETVAAALAQRGFVAFNVNYTLAGWAGPGFTRQLAELTAAVRWVRRHAARFGVDRARIGALGSSAGAHLAALLGARGRGSLSEGARVRAVVAWSGPFDLTRLRTPALAPAVQTFLGCAPAACPQRAAAESPVEHVTPDDPEMLIVSSEHDLVPVDQARTMAARLASAGVRHRLWILPGTAHGREYAATALGPSVAFLTRRLR